jgi:hypothetical protein
MASGSDSLACPVKRLSFFKSKAPRGQLKDLAAGRCIAFGRSIVNSGCRCSATQKSIGDVYLGLASPG